MLCQVFPELYDQQLSDKVARLNALIPALPPHTDVFASAKSHYRARAEFSIWHQGPQSDYIMFDTDTKQKVIIQRCPMVSESISDLMPKLMQLIMQNELLRTRLFEIDFLSTLSGQMLVTLIYRKPIEDDQAWLNAAQVLKQQLPITHIIGRGRKQKLLLDADYVVETLQVDGHDFIYQQIENSFTQPNAQVAQSMLHWARKMSQQTTGDLLELYCGNGHFSIALAEHYPRVLATEISRSSVTSAQFNLAANGVSNVTVLKMAAEDVSSALAGQTFKRMGDVSLDDYDFKTILVDPPRSGLDDLTRQMVTQFEFILYISCNSDTLAFDLQHILLTHDVVASALFDQFPYSHHIESGVFLKRKKAVEDNT
ncbi:tRNA (uridine(54)-C5)-methyltransferase TrmA [Thiomicrorhabdus aquaedulcis]|uniref:tRNA (uridine(54)-C5)-methyltransferase TrmA n=1 Tax=Thiomicrorhabdus aquaedulcis TaxID=2211106 RepID=UPI000FD936CB|nr:tRNA (uridine(54)-C5)-methyltransferase TrmA [Thiomicrorhabdus aquaedulcis]